MVIMALLALIMEIVDSGLGMMYGTLLSPIFILMGYSPKLVVPSILISQAIGGSVASVFHHKRGNSNFSGLTRDMKISLAIIVPGLLACVAGVFAAKLIPVLYMKSYIGTLVVVMGFLCLFPIYYTFTWKKMFGIGLLAGFNKAFSGGGFGPVTSTGKILGGVDPKVSVGTTTLAEAPICFVSFALWCVFIGSLPWQFPLTLCVGSLVGAVIGPTVTARLRTSALRKVVGALAIISGVWLLINILGG